MLGLTLPIKAEVVLANISAATPATYVTGGAADTNLWFTTTTAANFLAIRSIKLFGQAGGTLGVTFRYAGSSGATTLSGVESAAGEYLFDIAGLNLPPNNPFSPTYQNALEIRSVTGTAGIQIALNANPTTEVAGYDFLNYNGNNIRFQLSTTAVPEPGTFLLGSIAAACGGGAWWRRRRNFLEKTATVDKSSAGV